jgi:hypothetical protein
LGLLTQNLDPFEANYFIAEFLRLTIKMRNFQMRWTTLNFGKHTGKTLPEIILADADWFSWAFEKGVFKGGLANEAAEFMQKARAVKIPKPDPENWQVEYSYEGFGSLRPISRGLTSPVPSAGCLILICHTFGGQGV